VVDCTRVGMLETVQKTTDLSARERFVAVAAELFARNGYDGTSIRDIAREMGVTPGAVYAHFVSKAGLLLAVYKTGVERISSAVDEEIHASTDPWTNLERACWRHLEVLVAENGFAKVVIRVLPTDIEEVAGELTTLRRQYEERFRRLIDALELRAGTNRNLLRLQLLGALNWTQVWYRAEHADLADIAHALVENLRRGTEIQDGDA